MFPELAPHFQEGNPLYCHEDFLSQMEANWANSVGKRTALLLQRLLLDERREFFKSTQGVNKGWRRSRLGGNHSSHFYAWWAPRGATPLETDGGFGTAPQGSIIRRAIRHHDDHTPLDPQQFVRFYVPLGAADMRDESMVPAPLDSPAIEIRFRAPERKDPSRLSRIRQDHGAVAPLHGDDGALADAAEIYMAQGFPEDALRCYRGIPGFTKAVEVVRTLGDTPVADSLLWLDRMRELAESRPANFNKVILPSEKKLLEDLLETALGAKRRKPATKKAAAPRKAVVKKVAVKRAARKEHPYF